MSKALQNTLYLLILVIVAGVLYHLSPSYKYNLHGMFLPATKSTYQAEAPSSVKLLRNIPTDGKVIGTIHTMQHFSSEKRSELDDLQRNAIRSAVLIAAAHGANGLYIHQLGYTPQLGALDGVVLSAKAIRIQHAAATVK